MKTSERASTASAITDQQIAAAAYKGYNDYWTEDCAGIDTEAWAASGKAVLALAAPTAQPVGQTPGVPLALVEEAHQAFESLVGYVEKNEFSLNIIRNIRTAIFNLSERAAVEPSQPAPDPWHDAVLTQCMLVESCYQPAHPVATLATLIAWHVMNERASTPPAPAAPSAQVAGAMGDIAQVLAGLLDENEWKEMEQKIAIVCTALQMPAATAASTKDAAP